ncbi:MAG: hypothetical protein K9N51_13275 [Candidatus Pacebacteria bacterium]|nr:hypothetical protein [Candidatus Paceibacterota bacterium]
MNTRERLLRFMNFESVDRPPMILPGGPWSATRRRWEQEGLPKGIELTEFFDVDRMPVRQLAIDTLLRPPFKERILEESGEFVIKIDSHGVKTRNFKDESSMSEHLEYPIKGPDDLSWLRTRLDCRDPDRIAPDWLEQAERMRKNGVLTFVNGGMYFAFLNEHMGTQNVMVSYFDHPEFIHEVNNLLCSLCELALKTALPKFVPDRIGYHEDMAYKNGSMISPDLFRAFMTPYYKRITALTKPHGIDYHLMDSDGDIRELIPLWLECGINAFTPLEVAAGMDVAELRKQYGHQIKMEGGFDKRILASDKKSIKAEFERLVPVIDEGGYLIGCDHSVPPDVPLENYAYLVNLMKTHYGVQQ